MIKDNSFINQPVPEGEMETKLLTNEQLENLNKEQVQKLLFEKYQIRKTADFQEALKKGEFQRAENWLIDIESNNYVQYRDTKNSFLSDRKKELDLYKQWHQDGTIEKIEFRSNKDVEDELERVCGIKDTADFREALNNNRIADAENFLNYVVEHKWQMTKYLADFNNWLNDRQRELASAKK